ncbi:MAG: hypothetical protein LKI25_07485 [Atopobiaceae bacterium]|jgi:hypothetical protein|nr:hypothetical protein [Atopobiaceae bacterium]MCI2174029.1 hypothetical protein [Atopobiaceae bacterium]MCI2207881.1 hypothetical protein [Atopobiaceae bacterium]
MAFMSALLVNGALYVFLGLAAVSVLLIVVGAGVAIVFALRRKRRREQGRTLGLKVAIPIMLLVIGIAMAIPLSLMAKGYIASNDRLHETNAVNDAAFSAYDVSELADALDAHPEVGVDEYASRRGYDYGSTLLQSAVRDDDAGKVSLLLERGADPDKGYKTPLYLACDTTGDGHFNSSDLESGRDGYDPAIVVALLEAGSSTDPIGDHYPVSPLCRLVPGLFGNGLDETDVSVVTSMVSHGASLTATDGSGKRAIDVFEQTMGAAWCADAVAASDPAVVGELRVLLTPAA